jgi:hypothetical protein
MDEATRRQLVEIYGQQMRILRDSLVAGTTIDETLDTLRDTTGLEVFAAVAATWALLEIDLQDARDLIETSRTFGSPNLKSSEYQRARQELLERLAPQIDRVRRLTAQDPDYVRNDLDDMDHDRVHKSS